MLCIVICNIIRSLHDIIDYTLETPTLQPYPGYCITYKLNTLTRWKVCSSGLHTNSRACLQYNAEGLYSCGWPAHVEAPEKHLTFSHRSVKTIVMGFSKCP